MSIEPLILYGAGGHAAVVLDALGAVAVRVADGNASLAGRSLLGHLVDAPVVPEDLPGSRFHVAIGDNAVRARLWAAIAAAGGSPETIIHRAASVSAFAAIKPGCFVAAQTVIASRASLGEGSIVNHGAVIDHDCRVGQFSHIAPNATLGGSVTIGNGTLVGAGATVLPGMIIGACATIGAGAVVNRDVPDGEVWIGIPANRKKKKQDDDG